MVAQSKASYRAATAGSFARSRAAGERENIASRVGRRVWFFACVYVCTCSRDNLIYVLCCKVFGNVVCLRYMYFCLF